MPSSTAYLFPGQGAQAVGMGKAFYDRFEVSRSLYKQANALLDFDLTALCFEGPQEALTQTQKCQPALFVTSMAAFLVFREAFPSMEPVGVAGLSLGELTALTAAGALKFADALYVVKARAEAMASCAVHHPGAMLAIVGLPTEALESLCADSNASAANFNAPDQVVLSGTVESIERAQKLATERGAKRAIRLEVSGAFHSGLMQPAADELKRVLSKISIGPPVYPIISNVTAGFASDPEAIRQLLVKQIVSPVLWEPSMRALIKAGATHFIEFPPARILTGLLRRIDSAVKGIAIDEPKDFEKVA